MSSAILPAAPAASWSASWSTCFETYTSPEGVIEETDPETGATQKIYTGDLLEAHREHIRSRMFHGFDFDATMLRIAAMNLMLHGVDDPDIHYQDTLSTSFTERFPKAATEGFDVILANPPFKGSLDFEDVHRLAAASGEDEEDGTPVRRPDPAHAQDGRTVGDDRARRRAVRLVKRPRALRKLLMDHNQLEAVISLPSGVFKPYAGVSTGILVFTKGGRTDNVFFYDVEADGFSLDDKREPVDENDLPDCLARWRARDPKKDTDRTAKAFFVPAKEIREANYDLSLSRYQEDRLQGGRIRPAAGDSGADESPKRRDRVGPRRAGGDARMNMEPANLEERQLSDLVSIEIGRTPSRSNPAYWGGIQKWVTISDFEHGDVIKDTKERITQQALNECGARVHSAGTLIMSFKLTIGKLAILGSSMATNEAIAALKPINADVIDQRFLYHYLSQCNFDNLVDRAAKGQTLNKAKLSRISIKFPRDMNQQRRIAAILDKADGVLRKRESALALGDEFLRSWFLEVFGDPRRIDSERIVLADIARIARGRFTPTEE